MHDENVNIVQYTTLLAKWKAKTTAYTRKQNASYNKTTTVGLQHFTDTISVVEKSLVPQIIV